MVKSLITLLSGRLFKSPQKMIGVVGSVNFLISCMYEQIWWYFTLSYLDPRKDGY